MEDRPIYSALTLAGVTPFLACALLPVAGVEAIEPFGRLHQLAGDYGVTGVPVMVVDKHYRGGKASTWQQKFQNVNYLIEKARANRQSGAGQ